MQHCNQGSKREILLNEMNDYKCNTALEVNGNNVTMYGLACEHTHRDHVVWNGNDGATFFYQCTMFPRDKGYCGYRVNGLRHCSYGIGVYSNFRDYVVKVKSGVVVANNDAINSSFFQNVFTRFLNGKAASDIDYVINQENNKVGECRIVINHANASRSTTATSTSC
jgi:hypothetical protein